MTNPIANVTANNKAARIAAIGYLIIIVCGISAEVLIRGGLIETGNAAATAENITENERLFRLSIGSELVMLTFDAIVGIALFVIFRPVNLGLSIAATVFRLLHTAIYGATLLFLFFAVQLAVGPAYLQSLQPGDAQALSLLFIEAHAFGYALALVFFGVSMLLLGHLVLRSAYVPWLLGVLLFAAGGGYLLDGFAHVLMPDYADHETTFAVIAFVPAFIGEFAFAAWLLVKGINPAVAAEPSRSAPVPA